MKKQIMFFDDFFKQQAYKLSAYVLAFAVSYKIALFFQWRELYQLALQDIALFSCGFIFSDLLLDFGMKNHNKNICKFS